MTTPEFITTASSITNVLVNLVLIWQLRLYIGKELSKGVKKLEDKL